MSVLSRPEFHDEAKAFDHLERIIWNGEPVCPHCGCTGRITKVKANVEKRIRLGLWRCGDCKRQFTVKVGTVLEHARIPLHKMLQAFYLMTSSKKGVSSHQLHRILEITYKSAWFLAHRIREAMRSGDLAPFGSSGVVEADETFIGREPGTVVKGGGIQHKMKVLALVDRATGRSGAMVIDRVDTATIKPILLDNISQEARLITHESVIYRRLGGMFEGGRARVNHAAKEYVNLQNRTIHTNTIEGYFSIFKRGMKGTYQHCGKKHLHRNLVEFDFRYTSREACGFNDGERNLEALKGITGKRLTYRRPDEAVS